ncbi:MAG: class I adenylate-forming enzyme family protein [Polyangiales bacterium]
MKPLEVLRLYAPHDGTLRSMLDARSSDREFLVFRGQSLSYREVAERADRAAVKYASLGVRRGDRVGVMTQNHPSTLFTFFALARLGAIMVPINPDFGVEEARYVFEHAGVSGVLSSPALLELVKSACGRLTPFFLTTEDSLSESGEPPPIVGTADDTCVLVYTSGTTGFPKGVMHSQRNVLLAGEGFVERMHLEPDDRLLCVLPMFHINALFYSFAGALAAGATLILEPKFSASSFWRTVSESRATEVNTLAAVSNILMRRSREEFVPGHALRKIYGAPFNEETYRVFREEFGVPTLIEGYGMSEIPGVLNNPFEGPHAIGSMGKPSRHPDHSMPFAEMKVVDADGNDLPDGEIGELLVRTPLVMLGYYRDPEQTAAAFRDGWFVTGDLGKRDENGYFWFVARKKDIIRKRGENISGAELDRVIGAHPSVLEAAAIPVPSELGEDDILVAVVARPGETLSAEAIAAWCRDRLSPIKVPRYVVFVDALPKTATHRVEKYKMRSDETLRARAVDLTRSS